MLCRWPEFRCVPNTTSFIIAGVRLCSVRYPLHPKKGLTMAVSSILVRPSAGRQRLAVSFMIAAALTVSIYATAKEPAEKPAAENTKAAATPASAAPDGKELFTREWIPKD